MDLRFSILDFGRLWRRLYVRDKKMINRRKALGFISAGSLTARRTVEQLAASGISTGNGLGKSVGCELRNTLRDPTNLNQAKGMIDWNKAQREAIEWALKEPSHRAKLESILYEENRNIFSIDPDLALNNSYSMMAKIAYQRQRNVERALREAVQSDSIWNRVERWKEEVFTVQGLFDRFTNWLRRNDGGVKEVRRG